jgi:hypothetical protein
MVEPSRYLLRHQLGPVRSSLGYKVTIRQNATFNCTLTIRPEDGQYPGWDPALQYAIISNDRVGRDEILEQSEAILGILHREDEEGYPKLRYVSRAKLEWVAELRMMVESLTLYEPNKDQMLSGNWLEDQKWCII